MLRAIQSGAPTRYSPAMCKTLRRLSSSNSDIGWRAPVPFSHDRSSVLVVMAAGGIEAVGTGQGNRIAGHPANWTKGFYPETKGT
jgi:hypothetical protein